MEKIINYIARGQGLGIKFLLLFSLIVAVFYAVGTKFAGDQFFVPAAQKAADAFLPIRIENGIVTEPENTVKNYTFEKITSGTPVEGGGGGEEERPGEL